jgi:hypothetical protein
MAKIDTTVGKLVEMIKDGDLRLPEMQRRYVWPGTRVRDLLDSLYRGYPSGTILVWETDREMPTRDLDIKQSAGAFKGSKLLLDGQQRLTSLSAVLRATPVEVRGRKRAIDILFNLEHPDGPPIEVLEIEDERPEDPNDTELDDTEGDEPEGPSLQERLKLRTFVVASKALAADPHWLRVSDIFSPDKTDAQLLRGLVRSLDDPLFDKYSKRIQAVRKVRDYPYVMHVLDKDLSYEEVAEIFVRVNSLGTKLRSSDLALAQITSRWRNSLSLFEEFQNECEEKWFTLDLGLIVRALVVFTTGQSRFKTAGTIPVDRLQSGWEDAKDGLRFAINFMRANAGIEDESLLSSPLFLITVAYLARHLEYRISPPEDSHLRRWLYIANARGHYSGSSETILDADLRLIDRGAGSEELLELLRQQIGRFEIEPGDLAGRGQRSALFSTAYLALKARGAKDWRSRLGLSLTHQGRYHFIEFHHIFPKSALKAAGYEKSEINEIANMAFVSGSNNRRIGVTPAERSLTEVRREQGDASLAAHCVPLNAELWKTDNYRAFLEQRRIELATAINEFIAGKTDEAVTMDVDGLIAGGESELVEFKSSARWDYREKRVNKALEAIIAKTIAAFLNGKGGTLLIGVDDSGTAVGLQEDYATLGKRPDRDGYQQMLVQLISTTLGKPACASLAISFHPVQGTEVCVVRVTASPVPVYYEESDQSRLYVRLGNTSRELTGREMAEYLRTHWKGAHA